MDWGVPKPIAMLRRNLRRSSISKMDNQQASNTDSRPIASAIVTFLSAEDGGRKTIPCLNTKPFYRPHIVVQDSSIRHATYDASGMGNEHYMGIEFVSGPEDVGFDIPFQCKFRFIHPRVDYSTATAGATFTVREGGHIVAYGTISSVTS